LLTTYYKMGRKLIAYNLHRAKPMSFLFERNVTVKSAHPKLNLNEIGRLSRTPMKKPKDTKSESKQGGVSDD